MMRYGSRAFSLVEVVLALGICAFVLVALLGLFSTGLRAGRESEEQVQAANLASQILATRAATATNLTNFAIPTAALTKDYSDIYPSGGGTVGLDGRTNGTPAYRIVCRAGTNADTGPRLSQIYLMLSWPYQAAASNAAGRYEVSTYVPLY